MGNCSQTCGPRGRFAAGRIAGRGFSAPVLPTRTRMFAAAWVALLACAGAAVAGGNRGAFADLEPSASTTAWGPADVVLVEGAESARRNPAALLLLTERQISVSYADLFGLDLVEQTQLHAALPFPRTDFVQEGPAITRRRLPAPARFTVAVSATQLRGDSGPIGPNAVTESYRESEFGVSLAWRSLGGAHVGVQARILSVQSGYEAVSADGHALGFGLLKELGHFRLGASFDDVQSSLDWKEGDDEPLPRRLRAGLGWTGLEGRLRLGVGWSELGEEGKGRSIGLAADVRPLEAFRLRGGIQRRTDAAGSETSPSAGAGFLWEGLHLDWGFRISGRDLGTTHRWTASVEL